MNVSMPILLEHPGSVGREGFCGRCRIVAGQANEMNSGSGLPQSPHYCGAHAFLRLSNGFHQLHHRFAKEEPGQFRCAVGAGISTRFGPTDGPIYRDRSLYVQRTDWDMVDFSHSVTTFVALNLVF
jgi:hypothetical protein